MALHLYQHVCSEAMENETKFVRLDTDGYRWQNQRSVVSGQWLARQRVSRQRVVFWRVGGWCWFALATVLLLAGDMFLLPACFSYSFFHGIP